MNTFCTSDCTDGSFSVRNSEAWKHNRDVIIGSTCHVCSPDAFASHNRYLVDTGGHWWTLVIVWRILQTFMEADSFIQEIPHLIIWIASQAITTKPHVGVQWNGQKFHETSKGGCVAIATGLFE